jgi:NAD(P)H-flavin reductase
MFIDSVSWPELSDFSEVDSRRAVKSGPPTAPGKCIDAGSDFCPCHLAESGQCIVCSVLRGEPECACQWTGTCILAQTTWVSGLNHKRESIPAPILARIEVGAGTEILHVGAPSRLAAQLTRPGSFVFVRGRDDAYFDTPLAVVQSFPGQQRIVLAYTRMGPKTQALSDCSDRLWLRGPYWNGIRGHEIIESVRGRRALLVLSGMAQVCGPNIARTLLRNGNQVSLVYDTPPFPFVTPYLQDVPTAHFINLNSGRGRAAIRDVLREEVPDCLFSGGGKPQHALLRRTMDELGLTAPMATSRTRRMCCGEGVCGACVTELDGTLIRNCKTCLHPEEERAERSRS